MIIQSKANATPEEIGSYYKALRRCGCTPAGTLKLDKFTFKGWQFVERSEGGNLIATHAQHGRHVFPIK